MKAFSDFAEFKEDGLARHAHTEHQLLIVCEGSMLFEDDYKRHVLCGKNAAFIPQGVYHKAMTIGESMVCATVYFASISVAEVSKVSATDLPPYIVVFQASPLFISLIRKLCEIPRQEIATEPYSTALRLLYLTFLEEKKRLLPISLPQTAQPQLQPVLAYLDQNYDDEISLSLLEEHFFITPRTLERLFKKYLRMSFSEYLRLRRIFQATILLATGDSSILEISLQVGYQSLSSFYKAFNGILGVSPRQYRLELKNYSDSIYP